MSVCLLYEHPRILLAMKKRGFGEGRWNGYGGKKEEGETLEESAIREIEEESSIKVSKLEEMGIIDFEFEDNQEEILEVHFFRIKKYSGEPRETEEMRPQWFNINDIPYDQMWPDDKYWMPIFLKGKKFKGKIYFQDKDTILRDELEEIEEKIKK